MDNFGGRKLSFWLYILRIFQTSVSLLTMAKRRQYNCTAHHHRTRSINRLIALTGTCLVLVILSLWIWYHPADSTINCESPSQFNTMCFTRTELLHLGEKSKHLKLPDDVWAHITSFGLRAKPPTRRGRRGGKRHPVYSLRVPNDSNDTGQIPCITSVTRSIQDRGFTSRATPS